MYSIEFEQTQTDFYQFLWSHFWRRQFFIVIAGLFLIPLAMVVIQEDGDPLGLMIVLGIFFYVVLMMSYFAIIIKRQSIRQYKNRAKNIRMIFNDELFLISSTFQDKPVEQSAPYSVYKKMIITHKLVLLYMNYNIATIIPKRSIAEEDYNGLIELLKQYIPN
jgi:uncharacterized membrane protein